MSLSWRARCWTNIELGGRGSPDLSPSLHVFLGKFHLPHLQVLLPTHELKTVQVTILFAIELTGTLYGAGEPQWRVLLALWEYVKHKATHKVEYESPWEKIDKMKL